MALSHIPRSVGHNFLPEYQISSVPYVRKNKFISRIRYVVRKSDGLEVGTVGVGQTAVTTNGKLDDIDIFNDDGDGAGNDGDGVIHADEKHTGNLKNTFAVVGKFIFPKVTSWIQIKTTGNVVLGVYFSHKDAANSQNKISIATNSELHPLRIRCTSIYFQDGATDQAIITAGLTTIDRAEFENVVEKFLGDNIT
jgi:hypothetical protein